MNWGAEDWLSSAPLLRLLPDRHLEQNHLNPAHREVLLPHQILLLTTCIAGLTASPSLPKERKDKTPEDFAVLMPRVPC